MSCRYIYYMNHAGPASFADGTKIISMSLYTNEPRFTWGAIRNAQLIAVFFPGWKLRVYIPAAASSAGQQLPRKIINRLHSLGAQVIEIDDNRTALSPEWWSYLVADDPSVEYFLVRQPDARLSDRDASAVLQWINNSSKTAVHCIRDHASHLAQPVTDGLWGARTRMLRSLLNDTTSFSACVAEFCEAKRSSGVAEESKPNYFLKEKLFPLVKNNSILCHDFASTDVWPNSAQFPVFRSNTFDYVGMKYDQHGLIVRPEYFLEGAPFDQQDASKGKTKQYSPLKFLV
jgi:hypothetical protein